MILCGYDTLTEDMMADDSEQLSTFTFGGTEYSLSLSVRGSSQLTVQVEQCSTADQWRNTFDANCQFSYVVHVLLPYQYCLNLL